MNCGKISTGWESLDAFQKKGVPQALANPRKSTNKSKEYRFKKKISEKAKSVSSVKSVFNFLSITAGVWTLYYHRYNYSVLPLCPQPSAGTQIKKKKHGCHGLDTDRSFHGSFFWFYWAIDYWILVWIYLDLKVLGHFLFLSQWFIDKNQDKPTSCENITNSAPTYPPPKDNPS